MTVNNNSQKAATTSLSLNGRGFPADSSNDGLVTFSVTKNLLGDEMVAGSFVFSLFDENGDLVASTTNDANGLITFEDVPLPAEDGVYNYTLSETTASSSNYTTDTTVHPVTLSVYDDGEGQMVGNVSFPNGRPVFLNVVASGGNCGLIEFPELTYTKEGDYEYTMRELSGSTSDWVSDDEAEYRVIVHVERDSNMNLVATAEYPDGYPRFVNTVNTSTTSFIISACKIGIGAPIYEGEFEFVLYDMNGDEVARATNGAAQGTNVPEAQTLLSTQRQQWLNQMGADSNGVIVANHVPRRDQQSSNPQAAPSKCSDAKISSAIQRKIDKIGRQSKTRN